ncbi:hypothetical protein BCT04_16365 [Vibrio breoganii]|nr:hypothetical protein A1QG_14555 [Vibrio breoganii ZF-29]PMG82575.1 hypothetical protein BCU81_16170 [Vibrio breoganii]PMK29549.1 hypothetical protein BCU03_10920 [Vibrio breoganii]PML12209.1 hypothetical protein BCT84_03060 [Vibrio breoganii]PML36726.1 hypothetical protein BCT77_16720 [Vibrio breoganii]
MKKVITTLIVVSALTACANENAPKPQEPVCAETIGLVKETNNYSTDYYVENRNNEKLAKGLVEVRYRPDSDSGLSAVQRFQFELEPGEKKLLSTWEEKAYPKGSFLRCGYEK